MVTEMRSYLPDLPALSRGNQTYFDEGGKEKKKKTESCMLGEKRAALRRRCNRNDF